MTTTTTLALALAIFAIVQVGQGGDSEGGAQADAGASADAGSANAGADGSAQGGDGAAGSDGGAGGVGAAGGLKDTVSGVVSGVGDVLGTLNHLFGDPDKAGKGFKCTPYGLNQSQSCGNRALPPLEALCLAHCYSCQDDGTLRSKRQLGSLGDVLQPVQGLPLPLDGAPGVPQGNPLPGDVGPLSLTILQRCLLQCVVSLNLVGDCNVNAIVTELLTVCPHANLEVCCASACACCSEDAGSSNKCLDVCLQYLPPKISVGDVSVGLGDTFDLPLPGA